MLCDPISYHYGLVCSSASPRLNFVFEVVGEKGLPLTEVQYALRVDGRPTGANFDVVFSLSVLHENKEIPLVDNITCLPLLIYQGTESKEQVVKNAGHLFQNLHEVLAEHDCILTTDMAMFWDFTQKGACPYCACVSPAERMECTHQENDDIAHIDEIPHLNFWLARYVICVLHMKLRIVNHFVEHLTKQAVGSTFRLTDLFECFRNINLRYALYEHKTNADKFRLPSYKGNECDKIIANAVSLIRASVPPSSEMNTSWNRAQLDSWLKEHGMSAEKFRLKMSAKEAFVFRSITLEKTTPDCLTNQWIVLWTGVFKQLRLMESGLGASDIQDALIRVQLENAKLKAMWENLLTGGTYLVYEHILLDHGHSLLRRFSFGLHSRSQSSMEKTHGDQVLFFNKNLCKSSWNHSQLSYHIPPAIITDDVIVDAHSVDMTTWKGSERQEMKKFLLGKKSKVVLAIGSAKEVQLSKLLLYPFVRRALSQHLEAENVAIGEKRKARSNSHHKRDSIPVKFVINKP